MQRLTIHKTNVDKINIVGDNVNAGTKIFNTVTFPVSSQADITHHLQMNEPYSKWYVSNYKTKGKYNLPKRGK